MITRLLARIDAWALSMEGTVLETSIVWYDGTPVTVYIPHRTFGNWLKLRWMELRNVE